MTIFMIIFYYLIVIPNFVVDLAIQSTVLFLYIIS